MKLKNNKMAKRKSVKQTRRKELKLPHKKAGLTIWIKLIAAVFFFNALYLFVLSLALLFNFDTISTFLFREIPQSFSGMEFKTAIAIVFIIFALINFLIGRGLLMAKRWARNVAIVIGFLSIIMGWVSFIIGLAIALYLLLSKKAKQAFGII